MNEEMPLCECGCGERVKKRGNRFISGHNSRNRSQEILDKISDSLRHDHNPPICNMCGDVLTDDNWHTSSKEQLTYRCKSCINEVSKKWAKKNPVARKRIKEKCNYKLGIIPMDKNIACSKFLGIHVAERVLRHVFKDVEVMPHGNPGYDVICNHGKLIDIKSSCKHQSERYSDFWSFTIKKNAVADYFLCLAFDNREELNPLHIWLIPGHVVNYKTGITVSETMLGKWIEYEIDIDRVIDCCDVLKG